SSLDRNAQTKRYSSERPPFHLLMRPPNGSNRTRSEKSASNRNRQHCPNGNDYASRSLVQKLRAVKGSANNCGNARMLPKSLPSSEPSTLHNDRSYRFKP